MPLGNVYWLKVLIYIINSVTRLSVCAPTPPKLLGIWVRNLAYICIFQLRRFCARFYDLDPKVKVTRRSNVLPLAVTVYYSRILIQFSSLAVISWQSITWTIDCAWFLRCFSISKRPGMTAVFFIHKEQLIMINSASNTSLKAMIDSTDHNGHMTFTVPFN